jgi:hypothetical protein
MEDAVSALQRDRGAAPRVRYFFICFVRDLRSSFWRGDSGLDDTRELYMYTKVPKLDQHFLFGAAWYLKWASGRGLPVPGTKPRIALVGFGSCQGVLGFTMRILSWSLMHLTVMYPLLKY